jgi:hypothetical protein
MATEQIVVATTDGGFCHEVGIVLGRDSGRVGDGRQYAGVVAAGANRQGRRSHLQCQ